MAQCTAHSKRSRQRCQRAAMHGMTVCYMHGGKSPIGMGSRALTRGGRYSKFLPLRLAAQYDTAEKDPDLLNLRNEIALSETRLIDLLKRIDSGEAGAIWGDAKKGMAEFQKARALGDTEKMRTALSAIEAVIDRGVEDWRLWREIGEQIEQRRRLVESEHKRLVAMDLVITADRAMLLMAAVVSLIREHVHDRSALDQISRGIGALLTRHDPTGALAGDHGR
jgi:hypothetical protein